MELQGSSPYSQKSSIQSYLELVHKFSIFFSNAHYSFISPSMSVIQNGPYSHLRFIFLRFIASS
jgi:hypothetical protein